jgi:hypothetical protein
MKTLATAALIASAALIGGCERTDPVAPASSTIDLTANPSTIDLTERTSGSSIITAIALDKDGRPLSGVKIFFSTNSGTLRSGGEGVTVNGSGLARDVLTLQRGDEAATVTAKATGAGSDTVTVSTLEPGAPTITMQANPTSIDLSTDTDGTSTIVATVRRDTGEPYEGVSVLFSGTAGSLASGGAPRPTDANGQARDTLTLSRSDVSSTVTGRVQGYSAQATVTVSVSMPLSLEVFANPGAIDLTTATSGTSQITASVRRVFDNTPVAGVSVTFSITAGTGNLSTTSPVVTDSTGQAKCTLTMSRSDATATVRAVGAGIATPATVTVVTVRPAR